MYKTLNDKEWKHLTDEYEKVKYECKHCGHKMVIPYKKNKQLCSWCHNYVFINEQEEFKYRLEEKRKRVER